MRQFGLTITTVSRKMANLYAVHAEQADDLTLGHLEADALQHMALAIPSMQIANLKHGAPGEQASHQAWTEWESCVGRQSSQS